MENYKFIDRLGVNKFLRSTLPGWKMEHSIRRLAPKFAFLFLRLSSFIMFFLVNSSLIVLTHFHFLMCHDVNEYHPMLTTRFLILYTLKTFRALFINALIRSIFYNNHVHVRIFLCTKRFPFNFSVLTVRKQEN